MRKGRGAPCASPRLDATRDLSVLSSRYRLRNGRTTACYSPRLSRPRSTHRQPPVSSRPPPTTSPAFSPCARPIHPRYLYCSIPIHQCVHPTRERRTAPLIHTVPSTVSAVAPSKQLNPILAGQSSSHRAPTHAMKAHNHSNAAYLTVSSCRSVGSTLIGRTDPIPPQSLAARPLLTKASTAGVLS